MRFAAHRNQGTYAAAYQPRISTVDGQATFFEIDRQDMRIHELFRGYSLHRDYNYRPELPEHLRWQLVEPSPGNQKATSTTSTADVDDIKERQRLYDQRRRARDRVLRSHQISNDEELWTSEDFPYESDFIQAKKLMPERDRLAETLFRKGSLRDQVGMLVMDDLVRLLQGSKSQTYCQGLNGSYDKCDTCQKSRNRYDIRHSSLTPPTLLTWRQSQPGKVVDACLPLSQGSFENGRSP
jgi:hypothetical protein